MKVLIVARCKYGHYAPFIVEQVNALQKAGVECQYFGIRKNGYLKQFPEFLRTINKFQPDIIHAHYGICGLFATLQKRVPVVTTYHGSDINNSKILRLSKIAVRRSEFNVFVSQKNIDTAKPKGKYALIPCGINLDDYPEMSKENARSEMGLDQEKKYVLFAGAFDNQVKNPVLAQSAMTCISDAELIELKGYSRHQVAALMYAADALLMTSHTEGSPQVIKEALACGCPIVSVDVGDVKDTINGVEGCYIAERDKDSIAASLLQAINFQKRTVGRQKILELGLENNTIAGRIVEIYHLIKK